MREGQVHTAGDFMSGEVIVCNPRVLEIGTGCVLLSSHG